MEINEFDMDWKNILIKKYASYGLDETDVMVVFVSDSLLRIQSDVILTYDVLSDYMTARKEAIDASLTKLMKKTYLVMTANETGIHASFDEFKKKLFLDVLKDSILKDKTEISRSDNDTVDLLNNLETLNGRSFSAIERDKISFWMKEGADDGMIKEACKQAVTKSGIISFKVADQLIRDMLTSDERKKLGTSTYDHDDEHKRDEEIKDILFNSDWTNNGR